MGDILVRKVDDDAIARLKQRAAAEKRSVNELAREAIERAARPSRAELLRRAAEIRAMSPYSDVDSTQLIREDRDNDEPYR
jgi:plasmid stability protein